MFIISLCISSLTISCYSSIENPFLISAVIANHEDISIIHFVRRKFTLLLLLYGCDFFFSSYLMWTHAISRAWLGWSLTLSSDLLWVECVYLGRRVYFFGRCGNRILSLLLLILIAFLGTQSSVIVTFRKFTFTNLFSFSTRLLFNVVFKELTVVLFW